MSQIITNDKKFLTQIGKYCKSTLKESQPDNIICGYCGKPKKQMGRVWFCISCKSARLSSGKPIGKIPAKIYQKK